MSDYANGNEVEVRLASDDAWYWGYVIDERKMWVQLYNYDRPFIADENNILEIRSARQSGDGFAYRAWRLYAAPAWLFRSLHPLRHAKREYCLRAFWLEHHWRPAQGSELQ